MGLPGAIIAAAAALSAGSIVSSNMAVGAQEKATQDTNNQQNKLLADAKSKQDQEKASQESMAARDSARNRQKALAASSSGRQDTILTGPLGLTDQPNNQYKTILGA